MATESAAAHVLGVEYTGACTRYTHARIHMLSGRTRRDGQHREARIHAQQARARDTAATDKRKSEQRASGQLCLCAVGVRVARAIKNGVEKPRIHMHAPFVWRIETAFV